MDSLWTIIRTLAMPVKLTWSGQYHRLSRVLNDHISSMVIFIKNIYVETRMLLLVRKGVFIKYMALKWFQI